MLARTYMDGIFVHLHTPNCLVGIAGRVSGAYRSEEKVTNATKDLASISNCARDFTILGLSTGYVMYDETRNINSGHRRVIGDLVGPDIWKRVKILNLGKVSEPN
jgi:hypothetical protein